MMYWLVNWSVRFRRIVVPIAAALIIAGFVQLNDIKRDILPEFNATTVEVQTEALGLSAAEVERLITTPLEQDLLNGVAFLDTIESASLPGLSSVVMTFEPGTDMLDARQVVAERLTQAAGLPQVAKPPQMIQPLSSTSRVAMVSLQSEELTPIETSVLARWVMIPRLLGVDGVANVSIWGFRDQQLQVLVDPARLASQNVTLSQVIRTAGNALEVSPLSFLEASSPGTGGFIDTVNQRLQVFHEQAISTPEELAQVTLEGPEGGAVFVAGEALALGDVADIVTDHQPLIGDALCSGGPCTLLVIEKFPDANTPEVASGIEDALAALSLGLPGMEIDTSVYRPADTIDASFGNLRLALLVSLALMLLVLTLMFLDWRIALISAVSIGSSLAAAVAILALLDATVNVMILAGLVMALVVIIADAVVAAWGAAEAARSNETEGTGTVPAIIDSVLRSRNVAIYSTVIVAAVMLPLVGMGGEAGAFLKPIALAYLLAVAAAIVVGLIVTPALSAFLMADTTYHRRESPIGRWIADRYRRSGPHFVTRTGAAVATLGVLVAAGLVASTFLNQSMRPAILERDILIQLQAAPGTSLPLMDDITAQIVDDLSSQPGVGSIGAHVGRAIMSDQIVNVNSAEIWISIDPSADYAATVAAVEGVVGDHNQVYGHVRTYSDQRVAEILDRPGDELVVRIYGENPGIRADMAEQVRSLMMSVEGIDDPRIDVGIDEPTIEIEVDLQMARVFGVKPGDVRRQAATLVSGITVGNLFEDQKVFDVVVWGAPEIRRTVTDVRLLPIATPSGDDVPLGELADVRVVPNPTVIRHESVATYVDVTASVAGRTVAAAAADVDEGLETIRFPLEHHAEVLGSFADVREAQSRALALVAMALILIYLLFQAAFTSWRLATLAFATLPGAVAGSLIGVALTGGHFTLGSVAGTVAIFGVATHGVILMIRSYERRESLGEAFGSDLVVDETARLVIPAATAAAAIIAVFAPLAIVGTRPGFELAGPMATAVLGGLVTTALLMVVVVPSLYLRWGHVADPDTSADDLFAADRIPTTTGG